MQDTDLKICLIDPRPIVIEGLKSHFASVKGITIAGVCSERDAGIAMIAWAKPKIVIIQDRFAMEDGGSLLRKIMTAAPNVEVILLADIEDAMCAERAIKAGAKGYLMASAAAEDLAADIRRVANGDIAMPTHLNNEILTRLAGRRNRRNDVLDVLSEREREIFQLTAQGLEAKVIARELGISPRTVDVHRAHIRKKLGIRGLHELTRYALEVTRKQDTRDEPTADMGGGNNPILLIEDDEVDVMRLRRALSEVRSNVSLVVARNGEEAIKMLQTPGTELPCLILLDINMPRMNGFEFLEKLRATPELKNLPVAALTSSDLQDAVDKMFSLGVIGYMVKPANAAQFSKMLRALVEYWGLNRHPSLTLA